MVLKVGLQYSLVDVISFIEGVDDKLLGKRDWIAERESSDRHTNIRCDVHTGWYSTAWT